MLRGMSDRRHQLVSDAPDRLDLRVRVGELVAELLYVNVDGARFARIRESPDVLEESVAREHDPRLSAERLEELELLGAEGYRALAHVNLMARWIDTHVSDHDGPAAAGHSGGPPQDRAD